MYNLMNNIALVDTIFQISMLYENCLIIIIHVYCVFTKTGYTVYGILGRIHSYVVWRVMPITSHCDWSYFFGIM